MNAKIRKVIASIGLVALCVAPAVAGTFHQELIGGYQNGGYAAWSGTVVVPSAGGSTIYLEAPNGPTPNNPYMPTSQVVCNGPLGQYTIYGPNNRLSLGGSVAAGSYWVYMSVANYGACVMHIEW